MQRGRRRRGLSTARSYPVSFAFGAILLYLVFIVVPSIMGIYYSLTNWSRFSSDTEFVGLDNYRSVFVERGAMWQAIKNTLLFTGLTIVTKTVIGLMLALARLREGSACSRRCIAPSSICPRCCR